MRSLIFALTVAAVAAPPFAAAQPGPAPTGHRQPTAGDVPTNDTAAGGGLRQQPGKTANDRNVDKSLNICPSC